MLDGLFKKSCASLVVNKSYYSDGSDSFYHKHTWIVQSHLPGLPKSIDMPLLNHCSKWLSCHIMSDSTGDKLVITKWRYVVVGSHVEAAGVNSGRQACD